MKSNNIPIVPQTYYEVQYLENEKIKLPGADEIKKNGLSDELREQLLNPNAQFDNDLVVFMAQFW